ncbi:MAG: transposase [Planctomycetes bacterium]|nr:transposase [Planctomycetota bacterium]
MARRRGGQGGTPVQQARKALNYLRNHWPALNVYTQDGRLPIDNNWSNV